MLATVAPYRVVTFDGRRYFAGEQILMPPRTVAWLQAIGFLVSP